MAPTGRRQFLGGLLAAGLIPKPTWADVGSPVFLSAAALPNGSYVLCGIDAELQLRFQIPLPARGHAAAAHPSRPEAVAFARRPGTFAIVIDCITGLESAKLESPEAIFMAMGRSRQTETYSSRQRTTMRRVAVGLASGTPRMATHASMSGTAEVSAHMTLNGCLELTHSLLQMVASIPTLIRVALSSTFQRWHQISPTSKKAQWLKRPCYPKTCIRTPFVI